MQIALQHQPHDGAIAIEDLRHAVLGNQRLQRWILVRVAVTAVDNDVAWKLCTHEFLLTKSDAYCIVIGPPSTPAQHDVCVRVASGMKYCRLALLGDAQEMMRVTHRLQRIDCDTQRT